MKRIGTLFWVLFPSRVLIFFLVCVLAWRRRLSVFFSLLSFESARARAFLYLLVGLFFRKKDLCGAIVASLSLSLSLSLFSVLVLEEN